MRLFLLPVLALILTACSTSRPAGYLVQAPLTASLPPVLDPGGEPSSVSREREVIVDGVSVVGRWVATEVVGDDLATNDIQAGELTKVLVINPTGRATLHGWDGREGTGEPVTFVGLIQRGRLWLAELSGEATLRVRGGELFLTDPGATTTVYRWEGR